MSTMQHLASPIAKSFSEVLRIDTEAGSWIFVAGQVGVAIPSDNKPISFEQEVRVTFDRIRESVRKLDADMDKIVSATATCKRPSNAPSHQVARSRSANVAAYPNAKPWPMT